MENVNENRGVGKQLEVADWETDHKKYVSTLASVSAAENPIILLELTIPMGKSAPFIARVCNDTKTITSKGNDYIGCPFKCTLPDQFENQLPKATLSIDNVSHELMDQIEQSGGAPGTKVRFVQVMPSMPDHWEWTIEMSMFNITANRHEISAELGFENLFSKPAVRWQYRPTNTPSIF